MGDVVDAVQVPFTFLVKHVLPLGAHYFDGIRSKENFARGPDVLPPQRQSVLLAVQLAHGGGVAKRSRGPPLLPAPLLASPRAASAAGLSSGYPALGPLALGFGGQWWHQLAGVICF